MAWSPVPRAPVMCFVYSAVKKGRANRSPCQRKKSRTRFPLEQRTQAGDLRLVSQGAGYLVWISSTLVSGGHFRNAISGPPGTSIGPSLSSAPRPTSRAISASISSTSTPKCSSPWCASASPGPSVSPVRAPEMFTVKPDGSAQPINRSPNVRDGIAHYREVEGPYEPVRSIFRIGGLDMNVVDAI